MITVNSISGGKTSTYMGLHFPADVNIFACVCIDDIKCAPKDPEVVKYCLDKLDGNFIASAEHDKTLKVMMDFEQLLGKEVVWVRGKSFDQIIDGAGCLPTWARRFCTTKMKIIPIFEAIYFKYGVVTENIGFRYDEFERAYEIKKGKKTIKKVKSIIPDYPISQNTFGQKRNNLKDIHFANKNYPLIDSFTFHKDIIDFWKFKHPHVKFPPDSNCMGCHHKPPQLIQKNYFEDPKKLEWFSRQEEKGKYNTWHDDVIPYKEKFKMSFSEQINYENHTMCNSGGCTD